MSLVEIWPFIVKAVASVALICISCVCLLVIFKENQQKAEPKAENKLEILAIYTGIGATLLLSVSVLLAIWLPAN